MRKLRVAIAALAALAVTGAFVFVGCGNCSCHKHTFKEAWTWDEEAHWKESTCGHNSVVSQFGPHIDEDGDGKCDVCYVSMTNAGSSASNSDDTTSSDSDNSDNTDNGDTNDNSGKSDSDTADNTDNTEEKDNKQDNGKEEDGKVVKEPVFSISDDNFTNGTKISEYNSDSNYGIYAAACTDDNYFCVSGGKIIQHGNSTTNNGLFLSFGLLKGDLEGSFSFMYSTMRDRWDAISVLSDGETLLTISINGGDMYLKYGTNSQKVNYSSYLREQMEYTINFRFIVVDDGFYSLNFSIEDTEYETEPDDIIVTNFQTQAKVIDSIFITAPTSSQTDKSSARELTLEDVYIYGEVMTNDEFIAFAREQLEREYHNLTDATYGTHTRNAAIIEQKYNEITFGKDDTISQMRQKIAQFKTLKNTLESDEQIEEAISQFKAQLAYLKENYTGTYLINKEERNAVFAVYEGYDYDSVTQCKTLEELLAQVEEKLSGIKNDIAVVEEYVQQKSSEIEEYKTDEMQTLPQELQNTINQLKQTKIEELGDNILTQQGFADSTSSYYYKTVIDNRIQQFKERVDILIANNSIKQAKLKAEELFNEHVRDTLEEVKKHDEGFYNELAKASEELALFDVSDCQSAEEVAAAQQNAETDFDNWFNDKLEDKKYEITVQGVLVDNSGVKKNFISQTKIGYGKILNLSDLPDPTASDKDYMPEDGKYYLDAQCKDNVYNGNEQIYGNKTLYIKIVEALTLAQRTLTFNYTVLKEEYGFTTRSKIPDGTLLGEGNEFIQVTSDGTVYWNENRYIENIGGGLIINCEKGATLTIKASTSSNNIAKFTLKHKTKDGEETLEAFSVEANTDTRYKDGYYLLNGNEVRTLRYKIEEDGEYIVCCPSADAETRYGETRISGIIQDIPQHKIKAVEVENISLQPAAKLNNGEELQLEFSVTPANAKYTVEWKSEDENLVSVTDGKVEVLSAAKADTTIKITFTVIDFKSHEFNAYCYITVAGTGNTDEDTHTTKIVEVMYFTEIEKKNYNINVFTWSENYWDSYGEIISECSANGVTQAYGNFNEFGYTKNENDPDVDYNFDGCIIAKMETNDSIAILLTQSAQISVYYTYSTTTSTSGLTVDDIAGSGKDWESVSQAGEIKCKQLGVLEEGEHTLTATGNICFCFLIAEEV